MLGDPVGVMNAGMGNTGRPDTKAGQLAVKSWADLFGHELDNQEPAARQSPRDRRFDSELEVIRVLVKLRQRTLMGAVDAQENRPAPRHQSLFHAVCIEAVDALQQKHAQQAEATEHACGIIEHPHSMVAQLDVKMRAHAQWLRPEPVEIGENISCTRNLTQLQYLCVINDPDLEVRIGANQGAMRVVMVAGGEEYDHCAVG